MKVSPIHSGAIEVYTDAGLDSLSWSPTAYPAETNMFETGDTLYFHAFPEAVWKFAYWSEGLEPYRSHLTENPLIRLNDINYLFYANFIKDDSYEPLSDPDPVDSCTDCPCDSCCPEGEDCPDPIICDDCPDPVVCDDCPECPDSIICPEPEKCDEPEECGDCPDCINEDSGCFINVLL
ncbi:MAG TPA: hypothetical protein VMW91_11025 [Desulfosporosinus sp.]|nr:hypothetical protein [Desulfosporosinus sp.]